MNKWSIIADHYSLRFNNCIVSSCGWLYCWPLHGLMNVYISFLFQEFDRYDDIRYTCVRNAYKLNVSIHLPKDYITPNITDYIKLKITAKLMKGMNIINNNFICFRFCCITKRKFKQRCSTIPPISTPKTIEHKKVTRHMTLEILTWDSRYKRGGVKLRCNDIQIFI